MPIKTGPEQNIITSPQNDTFLIQKKKKTQENRKCKTEFTFRSNFK